MEKKINKISEKIEERAEHYLDFEEEVKEEDLEGVAKKREEVGEWVKKQVWSKKKL